MTSETSGRVVQRGAHREHELLIHALDVLRATGYEGLTMDAVAGRAHCSKATLYRRWGSKATMIAAALRTLPTAPFALDDTGTLRGDLLRVAGQMARRADDGTVLTYGLSHAILTDPEIGQALRGALVEPYTAALMNVIGRAVDRRELADRPAAAELLPQLLAGALLSRPLFEATFADADYLGLIVDAVIMPCLRSPRTR